MDCDSATGGESGRGHLRLSIDRHTAASLELIANARDGNHKQSLFGILNNTRTAVGARLLRANLLRPLADIDTIKMRHGLVELLLARENTGVCADVAKLLTQLPDLDKMLQGLVSVPRKVTSKSARVGIDTLIFLKQTVKVSRSLAEALQPLILIRSMATAGADAQDQRVLEEPDEAMQLLRAIAKNLTDSAMQQLQETIDATITESTGSFTVFPISRFFFKALIHCTGGAPCIKGPMTLSAINQTAGTIFFY